MPYKIIDRVFQYLEEQGIPPTRFEKDIGLSNGYLNTQKKRSADVGETVINKIIDNSLLSVEWLITGNGEMFKNSSIMVNEPVSAYVMRTDSKTVTQSIPLYNFEASAGLVKLFSGNQNILDYLTIPNLPPCDGAIYIRGDSMYPLLKAGDIVAYKILNDIYNGIFFGEMYLMTIDIEGDTNTLVKYIHKSDFGQDYIKIVSYNQHHAPKDIKLSSLTALALIKASVRINCMS